MCSDAQPPASQEQADLKKAFHAFRKRLKMTQLDSDSRLGHSPVTGKRETITAIQPPLGFGRETWDKLVAAGYLRNEGRGLYSLVKNDW